MLKSKSHNVCSSCWSLCVLMLVFMCRYDVTKFLEEHPGGEEVVLETAGTDATEGVCVCQ